MCPDLQFPADLVRFNEEILNQKLFLCSVESEQGNQVTRFTPALDQVLHDADQKDKYKI